MNLNNSSREELCHCCGKCCLADFIAYVREEDILRWKREGRTDIMSIIESEHAMWAGDHLISADNGRYLHGCPFLMWVKDHSACSILVISPS